MKTFNKIFILLVLITIGFACSEDELIENPPHILAADNLYVDAAGFEAGINGLYAQFRRERAGQSWGSANDLLIDPALSGTDNCYGNHRSGWARIGNDWGTRNKPTENHYRDFWNWLYHTINAANTIIDRAENPDVDWTEEQKNKVLAEARHFRAWCYRHLTFMWGDVPLNLEESSGSNIITDWERTPVDQVRKQMEEDWLFAEQHLPEVHEIDGRISKAVAQHYLAELYLTMGEPEKAKTKAEAVINNPNFSLVTERYGVEADQPGTPFTDMFIHGNSNRSEGNTEVLWTIQNELEVIGGGYNIMRRWTRNRYHAGFRIGGLSNAVLFTVENGGRGIGRIGPTRYAMELYGPEDDRGGIHAWWTYAVLNNPDRVPDGMAVGDTVWFDWQGRDEEESDYYWPSTSKWDYANPNDLTGGRSYNDIVYIRLAETYLLLAEAQFILGDPGAAAETINILRRRANASEVTASDISIDFILDERSRELWSEEHRRYTLLRTDKWYERTQLYNKVGGPNITERDKLFPIPQEVIDANLTTPMEQNPGY
jgi:hypothetical protein